MKNILIYVVITLSAVVLGCVQNTTNSKGDMEMKDTKSMGKIWNSNKCVKMQVTNGC